MCDCGELPTPCGESKRVETKSWNNFWFVTVIFLNLITFYYIVVRAGLLSGISLTFATDH